MGKINSRLSVSSSIVSLCLGNEDPSPLQGSVRGLGAESWGQGANEPSHSPGSRGSFQQVQRFRDQNVVLCSRDGKKPGGLYRRSEGDVLAGEVREAAGCGKQGEGHMNLWGIEICFYHIFHAGDVSSGLAKLHWLSYWKTSSELDISQLVELFSSIKIGTIKHISEGYWAY